MSCYESRSHARNLAATLERSGELEGWPVLQLQIRPARHRSQKIWNRLNDQFCARLGVSRSDSVRSFYCASAGFSPITRIWWNLDLRTALASLIAIVSLVCWHFASPSRYKKRFTCRPPSSFQTGSPFHPASRSQVFPAPNARQFLDRSARRQFPSEVVLIFPILFPIAFATAGFPRASARSG